MLLSRRLLTHQPLLIQRTVTTQVRLAVENEMKCDNGDISLKENSFNVPFDPPRKPLTSQVTHQVMNQVPPLEYFDLYKNDNVLRDFLSKDKNGKIEEMGEELGVFHWFEQGSQANRYVPTLHQFNRYGQRIDEVQYHPAYHDLMQLGMRYGVRI